MALKVHYDASKAGADYRTSLCGWIAVETETDMSRITCNQCWKRLQKKLAPAPERVRRSAGGDEEDKQLAAALAPKAPPPPRLDPATWAACCGATCSCGVEHTDGPRPCGNCARCEWERLANIWGSKEVSAHNVEHSLKRPDGAPRWPSLTAALVALADWEHHDRVGPSALGGIIARLKRGAADDGGASRPDDPLLRRAGELVRVRQSLELAYKDYPVDPHAGLSRAQCMGLLLVRTPGVLPLVPTYDELAVLLTVPPFRPLTADELEAVVRVGRRRVSEDLADRGLIPAPRVMARPARGERCQTFASRS